LKNDSAWQNKNKEKIWRIQKKHVPLQPETKKRLAAEQMTL
jgi:hypothetical protein